ncbi:MAG: DUF3301 domain-containing protein [Sphingomonadales bacterium]|nr:DUF3301 domain-containing protein [Sphingomonadales bacterium]
MPTFELFALLLGILAAWFWVDGARAREIAVRAAAAACAGEGLQFLDETVVLSRMRPARDGEGRLRLRREYAFEFSDTGDNRRNGGVILLGTEVEMLRLRPRFYLVADQEE